MYDMQRMLTSMLAGGLIALLIPPATAAEDVIRVAAVPCTCFAPLYIAEAKGYFHEARVSIEVTQVAAGQDAIAFLANGQLDALFGGVSAGLFNALRRGMDIRLVASMGGETASREATPPVPLLIRADLYEAGLRGPADLKGRTVAVPGGLGATGSFDLAVQLAQGGLTLKDVNIVNLAMPDMIQALKNRSVDAAITTNPFLSRILTDKLAVIGAPSVGSLLGRSIAKTGVFLNPRFAASHQDLTGRFVGALVRASQDLQGEGYADPGNLAILARATGQDSKTLLFARYDFSPALDPGRVALADIQQVFMREGVLKQPADLSRVTMRQTGK
mgnify:CR=1 FL=1